MGKSKITLDLEVGTAKFKKDTTDARNQLRSLEKKSKDTSQKMQQDFDKTGKAIRGIGAALGVTFGAAMILRGMKKTLDTIREFQVELANLRAITGLAAEDMDFMKRKAIELSEMSTKSAKEVVSAFKLVGSAKPELLKSADALAEVTKQAIILAEAGNITVPEAAAALTQALNMFGKSAKDAAKFTDILATSQQKGSAFIQSLAESMTNAGSVANTLGLSFETTNAVLQGFAKGGLQGVRAGTAFAMIMSKLASQADKEINPEFTDMNKLLDTLAERNLSVAEANKLVGLEAGKYLLTLVDQREIVKELNGALYEQGNAMLQAQINTSTMDQSLKDVGKNWDNFVLSIKAGSGIVSVAIKGIADNMSESFKQMGRVQRAEFEGMKNLTKWAIQVGSIIDPGMRALADSWLEASGEADRLDMEMDDLNEALDDTNNVLGGDTGAVGLIGQLKDKIKALGEELLKANTPEEIARLNREIKALVDELKEYSELGVVKDIKLSISEPPLLDVELGGGEIDLKKDIEEFSEWRAAQGEQEIQDWEEKERQKVEITRQAMYAISDLFGVLSQSYAINKQKELAAAGDSAEKREAIERKYARKEQNLAVGRAIMGVAEVVINALKTEPFVPVGLAMSILAGIMGAAQIAVIKSQKFATGILDLQGRGTGTSDDIPAMLSKGESVMTARETKEYYPYLKMMKEGTFARFEMELLDKLGGWKHTTNNNLNYDNAKEIRELREIKQALRERPFKQEFYEGKSKIVKRGNVTTRISLN